MQADVQKFFAFIWLLVALGVGLFLVKIILAILLKNRAAPGLVPALHEVGRQDSLARFVALIGQNARATVTMGTVRLRASLGIQLAYWGGAILIAVVIGQMGVPVFGIETILLLVVLLAALHTSLYEISYDRQSITLPRWWFGRTTHKWADLLAVTKPDGWFLTFHFDKGPSVRAHKYVVGYRELLETAQKAVREN
ncbi:hypothetical protein LHP98_07440 [Rhodobacter sp. Har01]|uniref:hypothetical protein n=1 Tax=Rhodobacter sp. Har01 TaxID=2883999 RepID=UPI001D0883AA|nr:hypothetical protein [Rhodobacter sp. Har01]MCB6177963.1 hypothetical protein [Rhodobacter sp. Har01]